MEGYAPGLDRMLAAHRGDSLIGAIGVWGRRLLPEGAQLWYSS